ncbi:hypothetical protein DFH08DRAFT_974770 [Mycena albidolilacea]|uniref:Uncharacterized protein n=1 Tax=Mycena albidolilacea TaxID=1033008 RepID=A0AAD6Z6G6_9AGAR|nr:hypothetical protein DFH08DRAFT_974770 [Mycena albidolilacea]
MNLAIKAFMRPFQSRPQKMDASGNIIDGNENTDLEEPIINIDFEEDNNNNNDSMPDLEEASDAGSVASEGLDGDTFNDLGEQKQVEMLQETKEANTVISRLCELAFGLINSTMIGLPAWHRACIKHQLHVYYLPRDVATCWNSTYNMIVFTVHYKAVSNEIPGDCDLAYQPYDLSNNNWVIIKDMVHTLEVFKCATLL